MEKNTDTATALAVMQRDVGYMRSSMDEMKITMKDTIKEMRESSASKKDLEDLEKRVTKIEDNIVGFVRWLILGIIGAAGSIAFQVYRYFLENK